MTVSFPPLWVAPRDFTDNDNQKLVLCGTAHHLRPTARSSLAQLDPPQHILSRPTAYSKAERDAFSGAGRQ